MYQATCYGEREYVPGQEARVTRPLSTTVSTVANINSPVGRLIQGSVTDALATIYNSGSVVITTPALTFTKPASAADTREGTCNFVVHNVPPHQPYFDLEMTFYRPVGIQKNMKVKLGVLTMQNGAARIQEYSGFVQVPAACPLVTSQLVNWTAGEPVQMNDGSVRELPQFFEADASYSLPASQVVWLTLSTDDVMDEKVNILSFRFTHY